VRRAAAGLGALGLLLALPACSRGGGTLAPGETAVLEVRGHTLVAELAADGPHREQGLMFRRELPEDHGMLFLFPEASQLSFWMRNTYLPLTIAFLDDDGNVLNLEDMQPFDETTLHRSARSCRMALEMSQGWFEAHGVGPGDRVEMNLPRDLWIH